MKFVNSKGRAPALLVKLRSAAEALGSSEILLQWLLSNNPNPLMDSVSSATVDIPQDAEIQRKQALSARIVGAWKGVKPEYSSAIKTLHAAAEQRAYQGVGDFVSPALGALTSPVIAVNPIQRAVYNFARSCAGIYLS